MVITTVGDGGHYQYQPPAVLNQAAPVQNQWYDILPETEDCIIWLASVNVEAANEDLQVQILIDGETIQQETFTATFNTNYKLYIYLSAIDRLDICTLTGANLNLQPAGFPIIGRLIQIQVRKITAAGAGNLTGIVAFGTK